MNFPKNLTVTYQVYRGWLTRGLSAWSINKVILSDSFGESYSLCKRTKLESDRPHRITLQPGDCHEEELLLLAEKAEKEALAKSESTTTNTPQSSTEIYPTFNITDVIQLGQHIPLERDPLDRNETESVVVPMSTTSKNFKSTTEKSSTMRDSWKPMITSNITKPAQALSFNNTSDIDEKSLNLGERMPKKAKTEKRSFGEIGEDDLMNSVPVREDSSDIEEPLSDDAITTMDEAVDKLVTVQLFQYRLGDVFEKAEKYARFTLFPLLSEQISNIFNLETTDDKELISTDSPIIIKSKSMSKKTMRKYDEDDVDVRSLQTMARINDNFKLKPIEKIFNNYEVKKEELTDKATANIRIDLPTYRPDVSSEKVFIPIEREP